LFIIMESYQTQKTKNGLKVILVKRPKNPQLVHIQFVVGIGSDLEAGRQLEIGHFLEHLFVSLTSKKHPDSKANRDLLSRNNISFTASIGTKNTVYEYSFRKTKLDLFLDLFVNGILDYRVDKKIFKSEQSSIIEELHEIIDDLSYNMETYTDSMLYRDHHRAISQKARLANTIKMTPGQIQNYWEKYYRIPYTVLAIYGSLDISSLIKKIEKLAKQIKPKHKIYDPLNKLDLPDIYPKYKHKNESKILFSKKDDNIATLKLTWRINMNMFSRDYYKIYALDFILINDLNSLILKKLRTEKGLIYDMESFFTIDEFQEGLSFYTFETTVGSKKILNVLIAFMEVIDYLTKNRIKEENFKKYIETQNQLILDRNESMDFKHTLFTYARSYLWGKNILTQEAEDKHFVDVNRDEIFRVSRNIFKTNNLYVSYSSSKNLNKEIESLIDSQDF
jgi:predicted Zn-dependent peptidase